ncbi:MAG TPA: heme biosynthesis HemY N-terminal domain-containing protein [Stellaceae bacterium]|nr:heme biosynthesis HemY N-terminal domain-containing protein [Stellaceae bacterium]
MIRLLVALVVVAGAIAAGAFFAGNPGAVEIVWQGWRIDTSVGVLAGAAALLALVVAALALLVAAVRRVPRNFRRRRADRRRRLGETALTRGLVALAAGDAGEAQRQARRATALIDNSPTALLLAAEAAQRQGDEAAARRAYAALRQRPDSEFLGLRGLIGQALRAGNDAAALPLAERAQRLRPAAGWLADSVVLLQARAGDWAAVHESLVEAVRRGALPADQARHRRGVALYELSRRAERDGDRRRAAGLAAKAQAMAPDLAPAAVQHARLLAELGRRRAATKALERGWRAAPHPDLARAYAQIAGGSRPLERAAALQKLADLDPQAAEGRLAAGEAALDAQLWGEARRHLDLALAALGAADGRASRRLCLAMARLAEQGPDDPAAARQWLDRAIAAPRAPAYVCARCGAAAELWQPQCPYCGQFDTLAWRVPEAAGEAIGAALPAAAAPMLPAPDVATGRAGTQSGLAAAAQSDK